MKEYQSKTGGRHLFNEDIQNLQDLALSATRFFEDCGLDFVITGCTINQSQTPQGKYYSVSEGYCFLNGKIRYVPARELGLVSLPFYICEHNITQGNSIPYADGTAEEEFLEYGALVKHSRENISGRYITAPQQQNTKFPDLSSAFFSHYSLIKSSAVRQYINSLVTFQSGITSTLLNLINGSNTGDVNLDSSGNLVITLSKHDDHRYVFKFIKTNGNIELYDTNTLLWKISASEGELYLPTVVRMKNMKVTNKGTFKKIEVDSLNAKDKVASTFYEILNNDNLSILQIKPMTVDNVEGVGIVTNISGSRETTYFFGNDNIGFYSLDGNATVSITRIGLYCNKDFTAEHIRSNGDIYEKGKKLEDAYLKRHNDNWVPLVHADSNVSITGLRIKNKYDIQCILSGTIPKAYFSIPYNYDRASQSHSQYYCYPLGIMVPQEVNLPSEAKAIGSQFYIQEPGYTSLSIPVNPSVRMLLTFVVKIPNIYMTSYGTNAAWCVIGIGQDRQLYLCGARYLNGYSWNSYQQIYLTQNATIEARTWLD